MATVPVERPASTVDITTGDTSKLASQRRRVQLKNGGQTNLRMVKLALPLGTTWTSEKFRYNFHYWLRNCYQAEDIQEIQTGRINK